MIQQQPNGKTPVKSPEWPVRVGFAALFKAERTRMRREIRLARRRAAGGRKHGGRPHRRRDRCTKRLGSRFCWNWREPGSDRCQKHPRADGAITSTAAVPAPPRGDHAPARSSRPNDKRERAAILRRLGTMGQRWRFFRKKPRPLALRRLFRGIRNGH